MKLFFTKRNYILPHPHVYGYEDLLKRFPQGCEVQVELHVTFLPTLTNLSYKCLCHGFNSVRQAPFDNTLVDDIYKLDEVDKEALTILYDSCNRAANIAYKCMKCRDRRIIVGSGGFHQRCECSREEVQTTPDILPATILTYAPGVPVVFTVPASEPELAPIPPKKKGRPPKKPNRYA